MSKNRQAREQRRAAIRSIVRSVPRGCVVTYGDVARALGPPCTPRQVGWALRLAHPSQRLPWHRVLAAGGRIALGGAGGLEQRLRLEAEGVGFRGRKVCMELHHYRRLTEGSLKSSAADAAGPAGEREP